MSDIFPSDLPPRLLDGTAEPGEMRRVVRELLLTGKRWKLEAPAVDESAYEGAFERLEAGAEELAKKAEAERREARRRVEEILARLETSPVARRLGVLRKIPEASVWAAGRMLFERSFAAGFEAPERAMELARLAVAVAEESTAAPADTRSRSDLLAEAWAHLGNALRIGSELREAAAAFELARRHRADGTGDPLLHARLLSLEASYHADRSRFQEAIALCRRADRRLRQVGDEAGRARLLIQEAGLHVHLGAMATAIDRLEEAIDHADTAREPRLALVVLHNLISYLDQLGRHEDAFERLDEARRLAGKLGHRLDLVRLRWLEGRIAAHRGEVEDAETCWNEAREAFAANGMAYDAAMVSLETAALYSRQDRRDELRRLAVEMLPIFESCELYEGVQVALRVFSEAARAEEADVELIDRVTSFLDAARDRPDLEFCDGGQSSSEN